MDKQTTPLSNLTNSELNDLAIMADMYCDQVQTNINKGDSQFNLDTYPELMGDDYMEKIMEDIKL